MAANASANDWVVWLSSGLQLPQIIIIGSGNQGQKRSELHSAEWISCRSACSAKTVRVELKTVQAG